MRRRARCRNIRLRAATVLCGAWLAGASVGAGQESAGMPDLGKNPEWFPRIYKPYVRRTIPAADLANTSSLQRALVNGKLALSLDQLKAVVRENNLDILIAQNNTFYAQTDSLRARGGGAPRGAPGSRSRAACFPGQSARVWEVPAAWAVSDLRGALREARGRSQPIRAAVSTQAC